MKTRNYKMDLALMAYPNELTPDIDTDYIVKVNTQSQSLTLEEIAADVAARSGKFEASEVKSLFEMGFEAMAQAVASGYCISTPLCYVRPMASGVVMEEELSLPIDREKVKVYASFSQGSAMKEAMAQAHITLFTQPAVTGPYIAGMTSTAYTDAAATTRAPMAAGKMAVITGEGLKVVGTDPSVGITLTSVSTPSKSFAIAPGDISPNTAKKLQFVLPAGITDGDWRVKVTTQYSKGGKVLTKTPRTFELPRPITIGDSGDGGIVDDPTA